jgi:hypothetical protein
MKIAETFNRKLLVEGNDDQRVIMALRDRFGIAKTFDIVDCVGIDNLYKDIPVRFKQSGIQTIGIIVDADAEINKRWHSLKDILLKQGFTPPDDLPSTGLTLPKENGIKVGVWIMPDNNLSNV